MADLTIKQHDTWPPLRATLTDSNGPINLTTAGSIKLLLKLPASVSAEEVVVAVTDAVAGKVEYQWEAADTAVSGTYSAEFEITWQDGTITTVPNSGFFSIEITPDLG